MDIHGNISSLSNLVNVTLNNSGTLNLSVIMEGFYNTASNNMSISDTAKVYLRNSSSPYAFVDSASGVINSNIFTGLFEIQNAPAGNYYIVIKHRNTIETWSNEPVSYTQTVTINYNFSNSITQAFGSNMKQVDASPVRFGIFSGDVNQDDIVDLTDIINVFNDANLFLSGYVATDLTGDDFVDLSDLTIAFNNSNAFVTVIRP